MKTKKTFIERVTMLDDQQMSGKYLYEENFAVMLQALRRLAVDFQETFDQTADIEPALEFLGCKLKQLCDICDKMQSGLAGENQAPDPHGWDDILAR
jgi:hypothetical protein